MLVSRRALAALLASGALGYSGFKAYRLSAAPPADKDCGPAAPRGAEPGHANTDLPWRQRSGTVNDVSCLSRTPVHGVVGVRTERDVADALVYARTHNLRVSAFGARHSMGGHAFAPGGLVLDMTGFNAIRLNAATQSITVQSGARWHDIQNVIHPRFAVKAMQSSDVFTVGGSISVNAHGMDHHVGAIERTIRWMRVMLADGSVVRASRTENAELYRHVVGGYGLFGIILDCELDIAPNTIYRSERRLIGLEEFPALWAKSLEGNDRIGLFYAHLSTAPGSFLDEMLVYTYSATDLPPDRLPPLTDVGSVAARRLVFNLAKEGGVFARFKWFAEKSLEHRLETCTASEALRKNDGCLVSRNEPMHDSVPYLFNDLGYETDILHEYFVPRDKLLPFVRAARGVLERHRALVLNASVRAVHKEDIALNYAPEACFALVLYINQRVDEAGSARMKALTSDLIDLSATFGGRFFLAYQKHYTSDQLTRAYPAIVGVFRARRTWDPDSRFTNGFAETYARSLPT